MAQGNRSSRPKSTCCRCRRRTDGNSRLTNLGWLCDSCYDLLQRSDLGRRLYRLVYHFTGRPVEAAVRDRRLPGEEPPVAGLVDAHGSGLPVEVGRDEVATQVLAA